jgi:hypothetical protein
MTAGACAATMPPADRARTRGDHFRHGFDGEVFGLRRDPAQRYWTDYGACDRLPDDVPREFERALGEIADRFGRLAIVARGGPLAVAAAAVAERLGVPARILALDLDGSGPALPAGRLPVRRVAARFEAFEFFAAGFASRTGSACAWTALAAFAAAEEDWPVLADHGEIQIVDHGVDAARGTRAGPPNLALADDEAATGLDRWMALEGRMGVAQPLRWSPALIAAQLACPAMAGWIASAGGAEPVRSPTARAARAQMWRAALADLGAAPPDPGWPDPSLRARMAALTRRLRRRVPGCTTTHFFPLHRLAGRLGIGLGPDLGEGAAVYGAVAPAIIAGAAA